ncbi:MAG: tRNA methyltransferase, has a role in tRNA modification [Watsoniomyces obsoletus]|nr:MAG: tRNA methyltransferase, has a role in tRNA modification [Watsoniomyces obsoletus]
MKISSVALFLLPFHIAVSAVPLRSKPRGIDPNLFGQFQLFSQWAVAAYNPENIDGAKSKVVCPNGDCPLVEQSDTVTLGEFADQGEAGTTGFVAADHPRRQVIVSIRGTNSPQNWAFNIKLAQVETGLCKGCRGHEGFFNSWQAVRDKVYALLATASQKYPGYTVVLTGHSLGGAVAAFAFLDMLNQRLKTSVVRDPAPSRPSPQVAPSTFPPASASASKGRTHLTGKIVQYTFGAPKFGNSALLDRFNAQPQAYAVAHRYDPVPQMPPIPGYASAVPLYVLNKEGKASPADILRMPTLPNIMASITKLSSSLSSHFEYFPALKNVA